MSFVRCHYIMIHFPRFRFLRLSFGAWVQCLCFGFHVAFRVDEYFYSSWLPRKISVTTILSKEFSI
ncbi:hypothetical protein BDV25DRAFT_45405 [Aspergillus avenaceus]|uniref:Uncharacterized protein n=1 Tax=Aspergillus avenaceus TaxID=36643 RepID=A0A5N6TKB3_ASPAV|nr:hypothetical protein BDV25DRAFT_45405 [Aspergillus avenaceus]